ncbi:tRNA-dihydrouridine synthase [Plakobranchus ocellatus]|uniref:tRNA-dihydrouridine(47) synthase [NAD(P)(+)] n=1 Tax=Plakobranchus ocellatus TaxID=259542 RepID=A0AAV4DXA9_9GAST|nr:tRNA-dihydrouridine synthase [Plakobranchus ocellatus]
MIKEANVPVIVDAGIGKPSDAALAMEIGASAVLVNTAIATATDPLLAAQAFRLAVEAAGQQFHQPVFLAPMEEVTDLSYRIFCKKMGADMVYTEFVNSDGLIRGCKQGKRKIEILEEEKPIGIQIYGNDTSNMVEAAKLAEAKNPTLIDINAGCWVKKVSKRGAGAGLLLDPPFMEKMIKQVVEAVNLPVTVKTRIGWDKDTINIVEIAKRLEGIGVEALTIHCRTRSQGHSGEADWSWIEKVKKVVNIPIIVNGGINSPQDALRAFQETPADGIMVARLAIGSPWVFREIKEILEKGEVVSPISLKEKISICLAHLESFIALRGEKIAVRAFRKYYNGYLKGHPGIAKIRSRLMQLNDFASVKEFLLEYRKNITNPNLFNQEKQQTTGIEKLVI